MDLFIKIKSINRIFLEKFIKYRWIFFFVLYFLASFYVSGRERQFYGLDPSYQVVLEYAFLHRLQFGTEIIITYGPLGFLGLPSSLGHLVGFRVVFAVFWSIMVAWAATDFTAKIPGWLRYLFILWFLGIACRGALDYYAYLVMLFCCKVLLGEMRKRPLATGLSMLTLTLLALIKFTFCFVAIGSIAICVLVKLLDKDFKAAAGVAGGFVGVLLIGWSSVGQSLNNLITFLFEGFEISAGYTEAMSLPSLPGVVPTCIAAGIFFLCAAILTLNVVKTTNKELGFAVILIFYFFITWKHGLVRGDHLLAFVLPLPLLFGAMLTLLPNLFSASSLLMRWGMSTLYTGVIIACFFAGMLESSGFWREFVDFPHSLKSNAKVLIDLASKDYYKVFAALQGGPVSAELLGMNRISKIVGTDSVDVMNFQQGPALRLGLNYRPRPIFQGYTAYTRHLLELNLAYFLGVNRPKFVLFSQQTIDDRFPSLDDALLLPEILSNYRLVTREGRYLLFQDTGVRTSLHNELIYEQEVSFDESIDISRWGNTRIIAEIIVPKTLLSRVMSLFYKPPTVGISVQSGTYTKQFRLPIAMASSSFLLSPFLKDNRSVVDLLTRKEAAILDSFKLVSFDGNKSALPEKVTVRLYSLK